MDAVDGTRSGRKRRRRFTTLFLLLLLALVAWFLPAIVARTSLGDRLLAVAVPEFAGQVKVEQMHLGWLSPVRFQGVNIVDHVGESVLQVEQVVCKGRLIDLLFSGTDGLHIEVRNPHLVCKLRHGSSNIEELLQPLLDEPAESSSQNKLTMEVQGGIVELHDDQTGLHSTLEDLDLVFKQYQTDEKPLSLSLVVNVRSAGEHRGTVDAQIDCFQPAGDNVFARGAGSLQCDQVAIEALQPLMGRFTQGARLAGIQTTDLKASWDLAEDEPRFDVVGELEGIDWIVDVPALFDQQPLRVDGLRSRLDLQWKAGHLYVRRCNVDSHLAQFTAEGDLNLDRLGQEKPTSLIDNNCHIKGRLNLAELASKAPRLLRLREDTQITAGELVVDLTSIAEGGSHSWKGTLVTNNLQAMASGRPLRWEQPLQLSIDAKHPHGEPIAGHLTCESEFLQVKAEGSLHNASVSVNADLDRLANDLRQLIDWGDLKIAGQVNGQLDVSHDQDGRFDAKGQVAMKQFRLELPGQRPLVEPRLTLTYGTSGVATAQGLAELASANLQLFSGSDQLDFRLRSPVRGPVSNAVWPVAVDVKGGLATWLPRLQPWIPLNQWQVRGDIHAQCEADIASDEIVVQQAKVSVERLQAGNGQVVIQEPRALLVSSGRWKRDSGTIVSDLTTLASSSLAIRADRFSLTPPNLTEGHSLSVRGDLALRGDIAQLESWFAANRNQQATRYAGQIVAYARFSADAKTTQAQWDARIDDFAVFQMNAAASSHLRTTSESESRRPSSGGWSKVWTDPKIVMTGSGSYDGQEDRLAVDDVTLKSEAIHLQRTKAVVQQLTTTADVEMSGEYQYDLAALRGLLIPSAGDKIVVAGQGTRPFHFRGSVGQIIASTTVPAENRAPGDSSWSQLIAEASVGWDRLEAYGLVLGASEAHGVLEHGIVQFKPIRTTLNGGQLDLSSALRLQERNSVLTVDAGPVVKSSRISPEVCQSWLQYIAPLLANSTRAEGEFSLDLHRAAIPVNAPQNSDIAGVVTIHSAQVSPGPMAEQLVAIARQIETVMKRGSLNGSGGGRSTELILKTQRVAFVVVDQTVSHNGFQVEIGDVLIETSGVVGMEGSLQVIAEVPIRDSWVERDRYLASLKGQTLKFPITGTISRPKVDNRALTDIARQMAASAAGGLLDDAINKGVQKGLGDLFKQGPKQGR